MTVGSHNGRTRSRVKNGRAVSSDQPDLFQQLENEPPPPADLDLGPELLGAIHNALRDARSRGLSRERVVDRMNALLPDLPRQVTVRQLNAWTAQSKEFSEFPARYLPAFCAATESDLPLHVLAQALQLELIDGRAAVARQLGECRIEEARLRRMQRDLHRRLGS